MAATSNTLHAKKREASGTKACRALRESGEVPAILYGHKEEALPIQVPYGELVSAMRHRSRILELRLGRKKESVLLKEIQYDALGDRMVHADLLRVAMDEVVELRVEIVLKGTPKVEHAVLQQTLDAVEVECLPANIPESFVLNVAGLKIDESRHVRDLVVPEGVKILTDPEVIFATLTTIIEEVVAAAPAPEEGAGVEPEVIGRKLEAEEGEEEAAEGEEKPKAKEKKE